MFTKKKPLLVVVIDALQAKLIYDINNYNYLENFIYGSIVPPFSFEPDAAYLCGRTPQETNSGTHFWIRDDSDFQIKLWKKYRFVDYLPDLFQRGIRRYLREQGFNKIARIPFRMLPYFETAHNKLPIAPDYNQYQTIFNLLNDRDNSWIYLGAPVSSYKAIDISAMLRKCDLRDKSLIFLFAGDLDGVGHRYGPDSKEYKNEFKRLMNFVSKTKNYIENEIGAVSTLVFGDHGMVEVTSTVNIQKILNGLNLQPIKDYIYFFDSTLARFWFNNETAKKKINEALWDLPGGSWISEKEKKRYDIQYSHNKFGDEIWWADEGYIISPNFWQGNNKVKGMHGYRDEVVDNHAGFLLFDATIKLKHKLDTPLQMYDVFTTIAGLLDLNPDQAARGKSILEMVQ